MISKETYEIVRDNAEVLNSAVIYDRDFGYVRLGAVRGMLMQQLVLTFFLRSELLWLQDVGALLSSPHQWKGR
jgi:hypothetical protein